MRPSNTFYTVSAISGSLRAAFSGSANGRSVEHFIGRPAATGTVCRVPTWPICGPCSHADRGCLIVGRRSRQSVGHWASGASVPRASLPRGSRPSYNVALTKEGLHMAIKRWVRTVVIVGALFVAWFVLEVVTYEEEPEIDRIVLRNAG